jgi:hypothetical protein
MERLRGSKPSPAMVVSIIALVFALAGSAAAGVATISVLSKKEKKQTRNIAKDEIRKAAPGLSVANATNATNAQNANALSGVGSVRASQLAPIVRRVGQFSGTIPVNTGSNVEASCDPGEVAISGGVDVGNSFNTHTVESRRLDADTWLVVVQTGGTPDTATAEVYCLQA